MALLTSPLGNLLHHAVHVGQQQALEICLGQHTAAVDVCWVQHSVAVNSGRPVHNDSQIEVVLA